MERSTGTGDAAHVDSRDDVDASDGVDIIKRRVALEFLATRLRNDLEQDSETPHVKRKDLPAGEILDRPKKTDCDLASLGVPPRVVSAVKKKRGRELTTG